MKRDYKHFLEDIIEYSNSAESFVDGMTFDDFQNDKKTFFAVIRALEVIGEAIVHVPDDIKAKYPEIPWHKIKGFRNTVIHEYFGIDRKIVWDTVQFNVPFLKEQVNKILSEY